MPFHLPFLPLLSPYHGPNSPFFVVHILLSEQTLHSPPHQVWTFTPWCQVPLLQYRLPELWHESAAHPVTALKAELAHVEAFAPPIGCDPRWNGVEDLICLGFEETWTYQRRSYLVIKCNDHSLSKYPSRHHMKRGKALRWTTGRPQRRMEVLGLTGSALDMRSWILLRDFWEKHKRSFFVWRQIATSEEEHKIEGNDQSLWKERTLKSVRRKALRSQDIFKLQTPWEDILRELSRLLPQSIN